MLFRYKYFKKSFVVNILQNCINYGQIKECNVEKISELLFALVDGIKEKSNGFTNNNSPTSYGDENMIEDV